MSQLCLLLLSIQNVSVGTIPARDERFNSILSAYFAHRNHWLKRPEPSTALPTSLASVIGHGSNLEKGAPVSETRHTGHTVTLENSPSGVLRNQTGTNRCFRKVKLVGLVTLVRVVNLGVPMMRDAFECL